MFWELRKTSCVWRCLAGNHSLSQLLDLSRGASGRENYASNSKSVGVRNTNDIVPTTQHVEQKNQDRSSPCGDWKKTPVRQKDARSAIDMIPSFLIDIRRTTVDHNYSIPFVGRSCLSCVLVVPGILVDISHGLVTLSNIGWFPVVWHPIFCDFLYCW